MVFSNWGRMCLFSGISGVITLNGHPAAHARVKRVVGKAQTQGEKTDEAHTDEKGYFKMPPIYDRSLIGTILPMEFVVPQEIFVYYEGAQYTIWSGVKRKPEEHSESSGKPLIVECEINRESEMVSVGGGFVHSPCTWYFVPDSPLVIDPPEEDEN